MPEASHPLLHCTATTSMTWEGQQQRSRHVTADPRALTRSRIPAPRLGLDCTARQARRAAPARFIALAKRAVRIRRGADDDIRD